MTTLNKCRMYGGTRKQIGTKDRSKYVKPLADWDNKDNLLTDLDLDNVMKQYDKVYVFRYLGIYTFQQCDKLVDDLKKIYKKKLKIGVILYYNYHWIAMLIHNCTITCLDSESIRKIRYDKLPSLCKKIKKVICDGRKITLMYNYYDIQDDDINCGIYVLDFLISFATTDVDFDDWIAKIVLEDLDAKRKKMFKIKGERT